MLANIVVIDSRSTVDIDFLIKNTQLSKENIELMLNEALKPDLTDQILYEIKNIETIKEQNQYGGFRVSIICKIENIRHVVTLDIATWDIITPNPIDYKYISSFDKKEIFIKAYPLETILSEKIQTIYVRGLSNSRSKDYYDLYVIYKLKNNDVNSKILFEACKRTFENRKTNFEIDKIIEFLKSLKTNQTFLKRWIAFSNKNIYARKIEFEEILDNAINLIAKIKDIN